MNWRTVTDQDLFFRLVDALEDVQSYLDDRADVSDSSSGGQVPNEEMRLLTKVRAALAKASQ